ncbi:MAG: acetyl-CoA C-acyltransferase, partial [Candidatus Thermoplasmatota archaeon]|nr:acetyl-CoA C-acyltransferase [Candidatus Thermoplasmatota archaeon]
MRAVLVGYCRTPFHRAHRGDLRETRPEDMAATVVRGLLERTKISPDTIEDLLIGCAYPEG